MEKFFEKLKRKFDKVEERYQDFQEGKDYTLSIDKKGNKVYDIHSEELRKKVFGDYESHYEQWLKERKFKKKRLEQSSSTFEKSISGRKKVLHEEIQKDIKDKSRLENKQEHYPFDSKPC